VRFNLKNEIQTTVATLQWCALFCEICADCARHRIAAALWSVR
jgi:hypothetical protein